MSNEQKLLAACVDYRAKLDALERENAGLKIERNRYRMALQDIADASGEWAGDKAREVLGKESQS